LLKSVLDCVLVLRQVVCLCTSVDNWRECAYARLQRAHMTETHVFRSVR